MRAMLSDRGPCRSGYPAPVYARLEAERILRETEPAQGSAGHHATVYEITGCPLRPLQGGLALAEALALFIEEA